MLSTCGIFQNMEYDSQEVFVAGIKYLIKEKKKEAKKRGDKFRLVDIASHINVDPNNLSGFLNFHRNYSETKRMALADFFDKSYFKVLDIGREVLERDGKEVTGDRTSVRARIDIDGFGAGPADPDVVSIEKTSTKTATTKPTTPPQADRKEGDPISFEDEVLKKHVNVLPNFQQKELALEINQMLVELEGINPAELLAVKKYVKFQLMEAKESAGTAGF